jgi:hypothetical protein
MIDFVDHWGSSMLMLGMELFDVLSMAVFVRLVALTDLFDGGLCSALSH